MARDYEHTATIARFVLPKVTGNLSLQLKNRLLSEVRDSKKVKNFDSIELPRQQGELQCFPLNKYTQAFI